MDAAIRDCLPSAWGCTLHLTLLRISAPDGWMRCQDVLQLGWTMVYLLVLVDLADDNHMLNLIHHDSIHKYLFQAILKCRNLDYASATASRVTGALQALDRARERWAARLETLDLQIDDLCDLFHLVSRQAHILSGWNRARAAFEIPKEERRSDLRQLIRRIYVPTWRHDNCASIMLPQNRLVKVHQPDELCRIVLQAKISPLSGIHDHEAAGTINFGRAIEHHPSWRRAFRNELWAEAAVKIHLTLAWEARIPPCKGGITPMFINDLGTPTPDVYGRTSSVVSAMKGHLQESWSKQFIKYHEASLQRYVGPGVTVRSLTATTVHPGASKATAQKVWSNPKFIGSICRGADRSTLPSLICVSRAFFKPVAERLWASPQDSLKKKGPGSTSYVASGRSQH